jgi:hypothetical protein
MPPSPLVFLRISTHSTTTPGIPHPPTGLQSDRIARHSPVEPGAFTHDASDHLRALYAQ